MELNEQAKKMVSLLAQKVRHGNMTLEQLPDEWCEEVGRVLDETISS